MGLKVPGLFLSVNLYEGYQLMPGLLSGENEKKRVALFSVLAAVFLTSSKLVIGVFTGSLGIISEALHSGLDMVAAIITFISVRISDMPADGDHRYGHGKVENLSAFIETMLLLVTCVWIIYEAVHRLVTGRTEIEVTVWSYIVVITSIAVDFTRSRALKRAAEKHNSQALEADALHFSTDIWSSLVVLSGLVFAGFGFFTADAVAALCVAMIVIYVSVRLGKRSVDVLLDSAPSEHVKTVEKVLGGMPEVKKFHDLRVRTSGADVFVDMCIHVDPLMTIEQAHGIADEIERRICSKIDRCTVQIHQEPDEQ